MRRGLSADTARGIPENVYRCRANAIRVLLSGPTVLVAALLALIGGCDMQSLRSSELFGSRDAASDGAAGGGMDGAADATEISTAGDASDARPGGDAVDASDAVTDQVVAADTAPDSAATGMLSGSVRDSCTGNGLDVLVGIAGRHTCSYPQKGSFFFPTVPLGTLKLAAAKDGYALYEATIEIGAGGNIHNIDMVPAADGGCAALPSPPVACSCTTPTCVP